MLPQRQGNSPYVSLVPQIVEESQKWNTSRQIFLYCLFLAVLTLLEWWLARTWFYSAALRSPCPTTPNTMCNVTMSWGPEETKPLLAYAKPGVAFTRLGQNWLHTIVLRSRGRVLSRQAAFFVSPLLGNWGHHYSESQISGDLVWFKHSPEHSGKRNAKEEWLSESSR